MKQTLSDHESDVFALAILRNGDIVSGSHDKTVKIWNENGQLKNTFKYHSTHVHSVAALPNGDIASGALDGRIIISDANGHVKTIIEAHKKDKLMWGLVVLPNGQLASSSGDNTAKIWF